MANNFSKLWKNISPRRRWQLAGLAALMLLGTFAEMATLGAVVPFLAVLADPQVAENYSFLQKIFASAGHIGDNPLLSAAIFFSLISVGAALLRLLLSWVTLRISFGLGGDLGGEVYRHILHKPYSWHVEHNSSEVISGIDKVSSVIGGIILPALQGLVSIFMVIGILTMLFVIDVHSASVAVIGFSFLYGFTTLTLRKKLLLNGKSIAEKMTQRMQSVQEGLGGIRDVVLDGTQQIYLRRFMVLDSAMRRSQATNNFLAISPRFVIEAFGMVLIVALAYWLSGESGGLSGSVSVLGALAIGAQKLLPQMQLIYFSWSSITGNRSALTDVLSLIAQPPVTNTETECFNSLCIPKESTSTPLIYIQDVKFRYKPNIPNVLNGISLQISRGMRVGIMGRTGSGKSTLVDIVMGLLEPTSGHIYINGVALDAQNRREWQKRIAHVPQSIYLSDTNIAENIAFGIPETEIEVDRVRDAASRAQLSEFIESLPDKYQTSVGERGVRLSGGQRQRIGLARALYREADVLILDEATSSLDIPTESAVMDSVLKLNESLTLLVIAHRLTTLEKCHFVFEVDGGVANLISSNQINNIIKSRAS